jgi:AraC-like DNA-binding protein
LLEKYGILLLKIRTMSNRPPQEPDKKLTPKPGFDFSRFLGPADRSALGDVAQWEWIEPFPGADEVPGNSRSSLVPENLGRRHKKWLRTRANTHSPPHREIMLTLRGAAVYSIDGTVVLRHPGTVILLDRHQTRDLKGSPIKTSFTCLWLHLFSSDYFTYHINSCNDKGRYTPELPMQTRSDPTTRLLMDAWDQCHSHPEDRLCRMLLRAQITTVLLEILGQRYSDAPEDHHRQVIQFVKQYIRQHLPEDLSLHSLANFAGYSPFFFHRLFLKHAGQTPVQFVNAVRFEQAAKLLNEGYTVAATAAAVGFSSLAYFHQFFRKHANCTPRQWAKRQ